MSIGTRPQSGRSALDADSVRFDLRATNTAPEAAPIGLGFHPAFTASAATRLRTSVDGVWLIDEDILPVSFAPADAVQRMENDFRSGGVGYGDFKQRLFEAIREFFAPMRARRSEIEAQPGYVDEVLNTGAERANAVANATMKRVRNAAGLE